MDKEINEVNRLKIGVREWAVVEAEHILIAWGHKESNETLELATKLEEYVLRDIT